MRSFFCLLFALLVLHSSAQIELAQSDRNLERPNAAGVAEKRLALVIGNGSYQKARSLANPANDATDVAAALSGLGFEVISGTNLSLKQMNDKVREFGDRLKAGGGVGLFYYAGHGIQVSGRNYLIPVDADIPREDEVDFAAMNLDIVLRKLATANNGLNIVVLDACRNNPFARSWSRGEDGGGLAQVSAPTGTFIAYATSPDKTASDGTGRNGLYTSQLLKVIKQPGLKIEEAFKQVTIGVDQASQGNQIPWTSSSLRGEFYFKTSTNAIAATPDPTSYLESAMTHVRERKLDLAVADLSKAIEIDPRFAEAYFRRGSAYNDQRKFELAIIDLTKATELRPKDYQAYALRSTIYCNRDETALAAADEKKVLELGGKLLSKCW
jgi:tetratricopeptide (TPR) repeat protein